nr:MAG TPA: hypothetical protein [Caudoviricetes sp.]
MLSCKFKLFIFCFLLLFTLLLYHTYVRMYILY